MKNKPVNRKPTRVKVNKKKFLAQKSKPRIVKRPPPTVWERLRDMFTAKKRDWFYRND